MYLSRIQLNRRRRDAWRLLSSPQHMHAAVLQSFPDPPTGALDGAPRVLWRLDDDHGRLFLYVVSPGQPDFAHLAEQAGWPTVERGETKAYRPLLDRIAVGQHWAFRLTANPTRYVVPKAGGPAKRLAHVTVQQQEDWLHEKAVTHGFRVVPNVVGPGEAAVPLVAVTGRATREFERRGTPAPVTIGTAQFDGLLEVTDADSLRTALVTGIGPAKAYGCGLLTLAPAS